MFKLPDLPYEYDALEPYIDKVTMEIHHGKHHAAYVDKLNQTLEGYPDLLKKDIQTLIKEINNVPENIKQQVINNGGGHLNHSFFWEIMGPKKTKPEGKLLDALNSTFGSVEKFKEEFTNKAMSVFGSGWAFLIIDKNKKLSLKRHSFQNSPLSQGSIPVLGIDLWEHAYYLNYQNRRLDYINAWWNVINWDKVGTNLEDNHT